MNEGVLAALTVVGVVVGLVGVLLPVVPGLLLVLAATAGSLLLLGGTSWVTIAVLVVLFGLGTVASLVLPARRMVGTGAPRSSLAAAGVGAVVGFFVVPVVGLLLGAVVGLLVAEQRRTGDRAAAWASSRQVIAAYGVGVLLELVAGLAMAVVWLVAWLV